MSATNKIWVNGQPPSCEDDDLNGFKNENNNLIVGAGLPLTPGDNQQTHQSVATYAAVGDFMQGGGVADAYTVNAPSPRVNPPARKEGMTIRFIAPASNTGACTLNAFGTGIDDIKLNDGVTDPAADYIKIGEEITVIDRLTYFELILNNLSGSVSTTVITVSGAYNPPAGVKSLQVICVGGGGGSGGVDGQGGATGVVSGGAGAGGYSAEITSTIDSTYNIVIGSGGAGGSAGNNDGANGGQTTVTSTGMALVASGGTGSVGQTGGGGNVTGPAGGGGSASGGSLNIPGSDGTTASVVNGNLASFGHGSASVGGSSVRGLKDSAGQDGAAPGSGASGAAGEDTSTNYAGGSGADGIVIITEYF